MKAPAGIFIRMSMLFLCLATVAHARMLEETVKKQLSFQSGGKVNLKNVNGNVAIDGWDREEFLMEAVKRVDARRKEDAENLMSQLKIQVEESDREISIKTMLPKSSGGGFFDWLFGDGLSISVQYTLHVPRECRLHISNTNGEITLAAVQGEIRLETSNGKITAEDVGGVLHSYTTNGSIEADLNLIGSGGDMEFTTTNGNIRLALPEKSSFDIRAKTTNGSIDSDFNLAVQGKFSHRWLEGKVNGGGPLVLLETTNGSIYINKR